MGIGSNYMVELMEEQHQEAKEDWIREQLVDKDANEYSAGWDELSDAYDEMSANDEPYYEDWNDNWIEPDKSRKEIYIEAVDVASELLSASLRPSVKENVLIMLHGHIVAALEGYLSSTFISATLSSDDLVRKLVETDPEFAGRKFTIKEIFSKQESLKGDIAKYLQDLIFHKIDKVRPMYKSVLDIDLGETSWLFKAVSVRHHCVHRAGYDHDGNKVQISTDDIELLIQRCTSLVENIDAEIVKLLLMGTKNT
ncbi:hypothetical protein [Vibrio neonatus]|uniref:hypothetical protein n=1 Tax=Vibrio neonatus TaxID=278860 RepID=UPI0021C44300|nr:hypothetical protein [Vibrio neonatus]